MHCAQCVSLSQASWKRVASGISRILGVVIGKMQSLAGLCTYQLSSKGVQQDAEAIRTIEHQPWQDVCNMGFDECGLKLWQRVGPCISIPCVDVIKLHSTFVGKSCLESSQKVVGLLLLWLGRIWEVRMRMDHIQGPADSKRLHEKSLSSAVASELQHKHVYSTVS